MILWLHVDAGLLGINEDKLRLPPRLGRWRSTRNDTAGPNSRIQTRLGFQMDRLARGHYGWGGTRQGAGRPLGRKTRPDRRKLEPPGETKMPTPKIVDFRPIALRARDHMPLALATLVAVMQDPTAPHAPRIAAANAMLDRAYGKPTERVVNRKSSVLEELSDDELRAMIAALRTLSENVAAEGEVLEIEATGT